MNIKVKFFEEDIVEAIGAGVYQIDIEIDSKSEPLYIGESVFVLVRCATHLYEFKKNPEYLGITKDKIKDDNIILKFNLIELEGDKAKRKDREVKLIKERKPLTQSGVSDF